MDVFYNIRVVDVMPPYRLVNERWRLSCDRFILSIYMGYKNMVVVGNGYVLIICKKLMLCRCIDWYI